MAASIAPMLSDYMENGFLENIIDMFKHDRSLYSHVPKMMSDPRQRVRLGTVALIESLMADHKDEIDKLPNALLGLMKETGPVIRADAVYLISVIGGDNAIAALKLASLTETDKTVLAMINEEIKSLAG